MVGLPDAVSVLYLIEKCDDVLAANVNEFHSGEGGDNVPLQIVSLIALRT